MRHIIYTPLAGESVPQGAVAYQWGSPPVNVIAAIVEDEFVTNGTIRYDNHNGTIVVPPEFPMIHTFSGWPT